MPAKSKTARVRKPPADLLSFALGALAAAAPEMVAGDSPEAAFLRRYSGQSLGTLPDYLSHPAASDLPLIGLAGDLDLKPIEVLSVALAAAVETNAIVGRAIARIQA